MRKSLIFLLLILLTTLVWGQRFSVERSNITLNGTPARDFYGDIKVYNKTNAPLKLRWVRAQQNLPTGWKTSLCNDVNCYPITTDSAVFTIPDNDSDMINLHFYPYGRAGEGSAQIKVYVVDDPSESIVLTFNGTTNTTYSAGFEKLKFSFSPNPVIDKLHIHFSQLQKNLTIEVYSIVGQLFKTVQLSDPNCGVTIQVSDLPDGYYFVRVRDGQGINLVKKFVKN